MPGVKKRIKAQKKRSGIKSKFQPRPPEAPEVIAARWEKKKDRIHQLAHNISRLRLNVTKDLKSEDEKESLTALIIAIIDKTGERIGNDASASEGHHGVSGFLKKHISIKGNEVTLTYTGKSGVDQEKIFNSEKIAKGLKKAIKNSPDKRVFTTTEGQWIGSEQVNRRLKFFDVSAKDLRGFYVNNAVAEKLSSLTIPEKEKDRKKLFNKTCKQVAARVGHGSGTCKKHYIVPELSEEYINHGKIIDLKSQNYYKDGGKLEKSNSPLESRMTTTNPHKEITNNPDIRYSNGGIPDRYKNMGFSKVGQKKKSTRPQKKWMVLAKKGDKYKVVHGGQKGMEDFSQHHDKDRQKRFWNRMGGFDSEKASDPFSPLYWHKRFGTWEKGGILEDGTIKVVWVDTKEPETLESKMFDSIDDALKYAEGKTFLIMELEEQDDDYYKWNLLPYGEHQRYKGIINWINIFEEGGIVENNDFANSEKSRKFIPTKITKDELRSIISGKSKVSDGDTIQSALAYIRRKEGSSSINRRTESEIEEERLIEFVDNNNLWYREQLNPPDGFGRGGEHILYEDPNDEHFVLKTNNLHLYGSWSDYLINLLLNNTFFPDTSYELIGFTKNEGGNVLPVVRQYFVPQPIVADLKEVQRYLFNRGFRKIHPLVNAYKNHDLGIMLGDLHDRNVLKKKDMLFFIDTKFFISPETQYEFENGGNIENKNYRNILEIPKDERIQFIKSILINNPYYSEKTSDFNSLAIKANEFIELHLPFDKYNPIVTKFNDRAYFEPDKRHIDREGYLISQVEYALHFITNSSEDKTNRFYDKSKYGYIKFILPTLQNPDEKYYQKENDSIIYVKNIVEKQYCCAVLYIELDSDGSLRVVTVLPQQKEKQLQKKKASGRWTDASFSSLSTEKSPSDRAVSETNDDIDDSRTQDKDSNNNDKKFELGGNIIKPLKIFDKNEILNEKGINLPNNKQFKQTEERLLREKGGKIPTLNPDGGYEYSGKDEKVAEHVGLITLPPKIAGTNCENCIFFKNGFCDHEKVLLPVTNRMCCALWNTTKLSTIISEFPNADFFPDEKLKNKKYPKNSNGGYDYDGEGLERAKNADLITLPKEILGTTCAILNCKYTDKNHFCTHPKVQLPVTDRMSCSLWNNDKVIRPWGEMKEILFKSGGKTPTDNSDVIYTEAFKKWFGDWQNNPEKSSKVVDKSGKPLVVYHGTKASRFHEFDMNKLGEGNDQYGSGFYFSNREDVSLGYGENLYKVYLDIKNPIKQKKRLTLAQIKSILEKAPNLKDSLYNFGDVDHEGKDKVLNQAVQGYVNYGEVVLETLNAMSNDFFRGEEATFLKAVNQVLGYDGHIVELTPESTIYVAFFPTQIKLADGSNTTFDKKNPDIRYNKGGLIAPNGKPSNLTAEQYKLVRTPEFKKWFGDWEKDLKNSSKAVDRNGEPIVYYHGSPNTNITVFDRNKSKSSGNVIGQFIYFSKEKSYSSDEKFIGKDGKVYEVFLNIRNPLDLFSDVDERDINRFFNYTGSKNRPESFNKWRGDYSSAFEEIMSENENPDFANAINKFGYDAISYHNSRGDEMFAVVDSNQIKLADGTNKTFDSKNPDIRYNKGGSIPESAQKQIDEYIKEGIFISKNDKPVVGILPIQRFNGRYADIHPNQTYVGVNGVARWKIKIREGARPYVLIDRVGYLNQNRVKDGHHRLKAYEELGFTEIPVIDVNGKILDRNIIKEREIIAHGGIIKYREAMAKRKI